MKYLIKTGKENCLVLVTVFKMIQGKGIIKTKFTFKMCVGNYVKTGLFNLLSKSLKYLSGREQFIMDYIFLELCLFLHHKIVVNMILLIAGSH